MRRFLLVLTSLIFLGALSAQNKQEVRVKIKKEDKILVDTTFKTTYKEAAKDIENLVAQYTDETVYISSDKVHSLYVFDITGEPKKRETDYRDVEIDIDKILEEFTYKIEKAWNEFDMDDFVDTASVRAKELRENMREYRATMDPELQELKYNLKEATEKLRSTRIIIIEDGDTIRIPKK